MTSFPQTPSPISQGHAPVPIVIFCKKNASDLAKLNQKLERVHNKVIIDDEADFATPNALINKGDVTRINR